MNRTIKEATVKRYHYDSHDELRDHLANFVDAFLLDGLKRSKASRHVSPSANPGPQSQKDSSLNRTSKCRD